jgi:hypothetical protein
LKPDPTQRPLLALSGRLDGHIAMSGSRPKSDMPNKRGNVR